MKDSNSRQNVKENTSTILNLYPIMFIS